jgi:1-acyl-sn-glycerol-3-phosphate acyltransferase
VNEALYDAARFTFKMFFRTIWRMQVFGAQNVPVAGGLIVASNHVSYVDPPLLGAACPRRLRYMAKEELFHIPVLGPAISAVGAYPVNRAGSAASAIKRSVEVLRAGGAIGIFPEGRRNPAGAVQARGGVALLASLGGVPVVPARLEGTPGAMRLQAFRVYFGKPRNLPADGKPSRDDLEQFTDAIMGDIRTLHGES